MDEEIDLRDDAGLTEIDLRDRLRFAADSLAADFGGELSADHAEALVLSSAEGLLASASVTEFVPILAERRARLAVRSGAAVGPTPIAAEAPAPAAHEAAAVVAPAPPSAPPSAAASGITPANGAAAAPMFAVPTGEMERLRERIDQVRVRVSDWRAELDLC